MPDETKQPQPEKLGVQGEASQDASSTEADSPKTASVFNNAIRPRRASYKPNTRATFIGLLVVGLIVAVNIGAIIFVMRGQDSSSQQINKETVTLSTETLNKLGMSKTAVDNAGTELVVGPNAKFGGTVTMSSNVSIAGKLNLNSVLEANGANLYTLQAKNIQVDQLNANGDGTYATLNTRKDLNVVGNTKLQGTVTVGQLLTVNNNLNVTGSLAVGGTLSVRNFQASTLAADSTLTIGGHMITKGTAPGAVAGGSVGSNGTVSISGNDASGTVAVNAGTGAGNGLLVSVTFVHAYASTPHVVVSPVGNAADVYISRTASGFSIYAAGVLPPNGYAFDYIVMQ